LYPFLITDEAISLSPPKINIFLFNCYFLLVDFIYKNI
jgi:hypothetical protein